MMALYSIDAGRSQYLEFYKINLVLCLLVYVGIVCKMVSWFGWRETGTSAL